MPGTGGIRLKQAAKKKQHQEQRTSTHPNGNICVATCFCNKILFSHSFLSRLCYSDSGWTMATVRREAPGLLDLANGAEAAFRGDEAGRTPLYLRIEAFGSFPHSSTRSVTLNTVSGRWPRHNGGPGLFEPPRGRGRLLLGERRPESFLPSNQGQRIRVGGLPVSSLHSRPLRLQGGRGRMAPGRCSTRILQVPPESFPSSSPRADDFTNCFWLWSLLLPLASQLIYPLARPLANTVSG